MNLKFRNWDLMWRNSTGIKQKAVNLGLYLVSKIEEDDFVEKNRKKYKERGLQNP